MGELEGFETEIRKKIDNTRIETAKIDERIEQVKNAQIYSLQMILAIQRKIGELEIQLGVGTE